MLDRPEGTVLEWLAIPLLAAGAATFAWTVWPRTSMPTENGQSIASRIVRRLTLDGSLIPLFPVLGVGIVVADLTYNFLLSATPALQTEDTIVLLAAATLLGYGFFPERFARERDFTLVFFVLLNAVLVVPLLVARAYFADFERSVDVYSWVALAPETSGVLSLLGVANTVHAVQGSTAPGLTFRPQNLSVEATVIITTACSGIYSFGIFASAFVSFILTEYNRPSRKVWALLALGFVTSYVANILRMVVIVLVGYYTDTAETELQNMLIAHSYAGWLIFLGWVAAFWSPLVKFLPEETSSSADPRRGEAKRRSTCLICAGPLTPTAPAVRCECGRYFHNACLSGSMDCPSCGRNLRRSDPREQHPGALSVGPSASDLDQTIAAGRNP